MKKPPPTDSPKPSADLESYWLPRFEAAAVRETDAGRNIGHDVGHRERLRVFQDLVLQYPLPAPVVVLDVGCGSGTYFDLYASQHWQIQGIDFSPAQIAMAHRRHPDARLFAGRLEDAPAEFRADLVVCIGVTQVVTDLGSFLQALARRVRPGGMAMISCLNARSVWPGWLLDPQLRFFSLPAISAMLNQEFEIVDFRRFYPLPIGYALARPTLYAWQAPLLNHGFMFVLKPH